MADLSVDGVHTKKTLVIVNNFVASTVQFLNGFSTLAEEKLSRVSGDLTRLEKALLLLETKLDSVAELRDVAASGATAAGVSCRRLLALFSQPATQIYLRFRRQVSSAHESRFGATLVLTGFLDATIPTASSAPAVPGVWSSSCIVRIR